MLLLFVLLNVLEPKLVKLFVPSYLHEIHLSSIARDTISDPRLYVMHLTRELSILLKHVVQHTGLLHREQEVFLGLLLGFTLVERGQ